LQTLLFCNCEHDYFVISLIGEIVQRIWGINGLFNTLFIAEIFQTGTQQSVYTPNPLYYQSKTGEQTMKLKILLILILTILIPTAHSAPDEPVHIGNNKPLALVIGNLTYEHKPLRNTINDVIDIAAVLRKIGFEVILKTNLNQSQMDDAIDNFGNRLLQTQTIGLFYFSGHGANVAGTNYLLPIDNKKIRRAKHLRYYAIDAHKILQTMEKGRSNSINIMILDACRNDPFPNINKSLNRGLSRINTTGSIIAFATAIGDTTPDNSPNRRNGLFTYHLISGLNKAYKTKQRIVDMFIDIMNGVKKDTNGQQQPWYNSSLQGKYCIGGCKNIPQSVTKPKDYFQDHLKNGDLGPKMRRIPTGSIVMGKKTIEIGPFAMGIQTSRRRKSDGFSKNNIWQHLPRID